MDVVSSEIRQLGGTLHIKSEPGKGSEVHHPPAVHARGHAGGVRQDRRRAASRCRSPRCEGVGRISARRPREAAAASGSRVFEYAARTTRSTTSARCSATRRPARRTKPADAAAAGPLRRPARGDLLIDQVLGSREIVVKPVGPQVSSVPRHLRRHDHGRRPRRRDPRRRAAGAPPRRAAHVGHAGSDAAPIGAGRRSACRW